MIYFSLWGARVSDVQRRRRDQLTTGGWFPDGEMPECVCLEYYWNMLLIWHWLYSGPFVEVINRVVPVYDQSEDASTGFTKICNESARRRLKNKERLLEKTVYGCHRGVRKNKVKRSTDERRSACSKKDIACRFEMWEVVFASEPQTRYYITVHGHTGHDPENNPQERKWLTSREQRAVENYCFTVRTFVRHEHPNEAQT